MLREKSLLYKKSPMDVIKEYSIIWEKGMEKNNDKSSKKKARELDEKLKSNIFPKNRS